MASTWVSSSGAASFAGESALMASTAARPSASRRQRGKEKPLSHSKEKMVALGTHLTRLLRRPCVSCCAAAYSSWIRVRACTAPATPCGYHTLMNTMSPPGRSSSSALNASSEASMATKHNIYIYLRCSNSTEDSQL